MLDFLNSLGKKIVSQPERVSTDTYSDAITGQVKDTVSDYVENFPIADPELYSKLFGVGMPASALSIPAELLYLSSYTPLSPLKPFRESGVLEPALASLNLPRKDATIDFLFNLGSKLNPESTTFQRTGSPTEEYALGVLPDVLIGFGAPTITKIPSLAKKADDFIQTRTATDLGDITEALALAGQTRQSPLSLASMTGEASLGKTTFPKELDEQLPRYPEDYSYDLPAGSDFELPNLERKTARAYTPAIEKAKIEASGLAPEFKKIAEAEYKKQSKRYPTKEKWQPLEIASITDKGKINWQEKKFDFARDRNGKPLTGDAREKRLEEISNKMIEEIKETNRLAKSGDKNSQLIMNGANWYEGIHGKLTQAFGGSRDIFGDVNAALSPNVKLSDNMKIARTATAHFLRGDYDKQLEALAKHIEKGGSRADFPDELIIRKPNGRKYNMNSYNAMLAMIDEFRALPKGTAPKMRQYAGNLTGTSNKAVIDIWASRNLQRHSGFPRLAVKSEIANAEGQVIDDIGTVGQSYGFAQEAYSKVANKLGLTEDKVQALQWLQEKELWERNKWTATSEGNDFSTLFDRNFQDKAGKDPERYIAGVSLSTEKRPIPPAKIEKIVQENIREVLDNDDQIIFGRFSPKAFGRYAGDDEPALDVELTATADFNPEQMLSTLAQIGKDNNQYDTYFSRILPFDEVNPNSRPALEVYFNKPLSKDEIQPYVDKVVEMEEDGFTFIPKTTMKKGETPTFTGFRMQFVPELEIRWDEGKRKLYSNEEELNLALEQKRDKMLDLASSFVKNDNVVDAKQFNVDTVVMGKGKKGADDYDEFINSIGDAGESIPEGGRKTGFGRPIFTNVGGAIKRIEGK